MKKLFSIVSNLQTHYHFKLDYQGEWLSLTAFLEQRTARSI